MPIAKEWLCDVPFEVSTAMISAPVQAHTIKIKRMKTSLANWVVQGNEFGSIQKRRLDLHLVNHFRNPFHDLISCQDLRGFRGKLRNRSAFARAFQDEVCNQSDALRIVQFDTSRQAPASDPCRQ